MQAETINNTMLLKRILNIYPKQAKQKFTNLLFLSINIKSINTPTNIITPVIRPT